MNTLNPKNHKSHVLVLGGYGTFGSRIVRALATKGFKLTITGRNQSKAQKLSDRILQDEPQAQLDIACFDVQTQLCDFLNKLKPDLVIHTCGPFQGQQTDTAQTILQSGAHYIDLSDSRQYIQAMNALDVLAKQQQLTAITGASTVPALSSAALLHLSHQFDIQSFESIKIGISPGQKTNRGLATTQAVLSYIGKPLKPWPGADKVRYGWFDTYLQKYPNINNRLMSNCEAPDLDLLPKFFNIKNLSFSAGMESQLLHRMIGLLARLVKWGLPIKPEKHAAKLLKLSRWFDALGSEDGGMHVEVQGIDSKGQTATKTWFIEAFNNHGPQIPAIPAIIMAEKILNSDYQRGVIPCVNQITLEEYLFELKDLNIKTTITNSLGQ